MAFEILSSKKGCCCCWFEIPNLKLVAQVVFGNGIWQSIIVLPWVLLLLCMSRLSCNVWPPSLGSCLADNKFTLPAFHDDDAGLKSRPRHVKRNFLWEKNYRVSPAAAVTTIIKTCTTLLLLAHSKFQYWILDYIAEEVTYTILRRSSHLFCQKVEFLKLFCNTPFLGCWLLYHHHSQVWWQEFFKGGFEHRCA